MAVVANLLTAELPAPYGAIEVSEEYKVSGPTGDPLDVLQKKLDYLTRPGLGPADGDGLLEFQAWLVNTIGGRLTLVYKPPDEVY